MIRYIKLYYRFTMNRALKFVDITYKTIVITRLKICISIILTKNKMYQHFTLTLTT